MFKPLQISDSVVAVSIQDPAIDWDRMVAEAKESDEKIRGMTDAEAKRNLALRAGREARSSLSGSVSKLLFKPGSTPTRFVIGVIPSDEMVRITDDCLVSSGKEKRNEQAWRSFLCGVRDIEGMAQKPPRGRMVNGVEYVDPDWLRQTFVRGLKDVAIEIGIYCWLWNQLTEDEVKN
jgi:hypothetical protein